MSEVRGGGQEEQPHFQGAGPRGTILRSRSEGAAVGRYPSSKVRNSSCALQEQRLRFAGAAVKRYPTSKVAHLVAELDLRSCGSSLPC